MADTDDYLAANKAYWDETVGHHVDSDFYLTDRLRAGGHALDELVLGEIGEVAGKSLLHLQCHFGLDTLSFARLGATVTGVDYSPKAIEAARALAAETGLPATFVESTVYDAPREIVGKFDIVFTSWGVLIWMPDIAKWAETVAHFLKPGGVFYLAEGHPALWMYDDAAEKAGEPITIVRSYFQSAAPRLWDDDADYADPDVRLENTVTYEWNHGLGDVVSALAQAGLRIELLHEHDRLLWQAVPAMHRVDEWFFKMPPDRPQIPLSYSIRAVKQA